MSSNFEKNNLVNDSINLMNVSINTSGIGHRIEPSSHPATGSVLDPSKLKVTKLKKSKVLSIKFISQDSDIYLKCYSDQHFPALVLKRETGAIKWEEFKQVAGKSLCHNFFPDTYEEVVPIFPNCFDILHCSFSKDGSVFLSAGESFYGGMLLCLF